MVEAIGWKAAGAVTKVTPVANPTPAATVASAPQEPAAGTAAVATMAKQMAAGPPVDTDRVSKIKAAIAAGKFPILPSTIADRLLALKLDWNPNEAQS